MTANVTAISPEKSKASRTFLTGGLVAGGLDITAAIVNGAVYGRPPMRILQSVASGLLGRGAFDGGWPTAALGLILHLFIATTWTAIFYAATRKLPTLANRPLVFGPLFGIAVFFFMGSITVPLSAAPFKIPYTRPALAIGLLIHIFCVGLPIALIVRRWIPKL
jgi:hypothetical protein